MNYAIMEIFIDTRILSIWNNQIDKIGSLIADYTKYDAYHSKYCINKPSQHSIKKIECCEYNKNKGGVFLTSNAILSLYFFYYSCVSFWYEFKVRVFYWGIWKIENKMNSLFICEVILSNLKISEICIKYIFKYKCCNVII